MRLKTLLTALGVTSAAERAPVATEETIAGTSETGDEVPRMESKMAIDMASDGSGSFDLEGAAAANTEVVKAKLNAMKLLGLKDHIEDILITLGKQYHLIRPMEKSPSVFIYVALDRKAANLGMARVQVKNVEQALSF
jgi:hypothetical protein